MARGRHFTYQYRLVWRYAGEKRDRTYVSDSPSSVLRMLRRIGTDEPWMGCSPTQIKRCWAWICRRLGVPFEAVADLSAKQALLKLRDSYPPLEYIRVEQRQVAPWTEMLDPLTSLRTASADRTDKRRQQNIETVEAMTREQLDAWRWIPDEQSDKFRRRSDLGRKDG
jgi:hypothetical protein